MSRLHKKNFRIPSVGKAGKGRESFPISFITSIFQPYSFQGRMAEVTEHPTCNQKVPSSNPVWNKFFFQFCKLSFGFSNEEYNVSELPVVDNTFSKIEKLFERSL